MGQVGKAYTFDHFEIHKSHIKAKQTASLVNLNNCNYIYSSDYGNQNQLHLGANV